MLITEQNLDIWYEDYKKQFKKTQKYVKSRGGDVSDIQPLSRRGFARDFKILASEDRKLGGSGVSKKLVKEQFSVKSTSQAEKLAEAYALTNKTQKSASIVTAFKYGLAKAETFYNMLSQRNSQLKQEGYGGTERAKVISQEFFGSE